jgi:3',5'-cyclic AMP phosphodiesterase CpdA
VIHLGDVYYSGTPAECDAFFLQIVNETFDRPATDIPVYVIPGNHDMYAAGSGFYSLINKLNSGGQSQPASFFCLRATDNAWQLLGMDTGLHDHDPFNVEDVLTFLETDEEDWHVARIKEFPGQTILLSHHQLFSVFS